MPVLDAVFAAAVTLSGCSLTGVQKLLSAANLGTLSAGACQRIADRVTDPLVSRAKESTVARIRPADRRPRGLAGAGQ